MTTYYTDEHEWISVDGETGTIGITDYAQGALGDIVFVDLPQVGASHSKGDEAAVVESVKAASEIYAPVDGEVIEINEALDGEPALVNSSAETDGWFYKIRITDSGALDGLMDADAYKKFVDGLN